MKRLDAMLLAGVGVLVAHQLGYSISAAFGFENSIAHGHMATAWLLGSLSALLVLASSITRSLRGRNHVASTLPGLAAWIAVGYIAMEAAERTWDGSGASSLVSEPVFWLGLVAAPLVALLLRWSIGTVERFAHSLASARPSHDWPSPIVQNFGATRLLVPVRIPASYSRPRRGPPV